MGKNEEDTHQEKDANPCKDYFGMWEYLKDENQSLDTGKTND
jgi:hypothetical protein